MANRYWVPGGTGSWTSTTNWSDTSGGASGASVPTTSDNVFFDNNSSSGDYTVSGGSGECFNFTITGSRNITFSITVIQIAGAVSDTSSGTVSYTSNSGVVLTATGSVNIRFGNRTFAGPLTFGAGTYTLVSSNLTVQNSIFIGTAGGTVNMGSNTISCTRFGFSANGTFNLNSSTIDITPQFAGDQTVFIGSNNTSTRVINAGTSTIIWRFRGATGNCPLTETTGYTFYEVRVKDNNEFIQTSNSTSLQLRGSTTISRLSFDNTNSAQANSYLNVRLLGDVTINNFIAVNSNAMKRMMVFTQPGASPFTITTNSAPTGLTDVTFFNVTVTGSAAPITGTRVVAIRGTTGVTPSAGKTVYWNKAAGGNWAVADAYAAVSGGGVDVNNYPLPQDTVIIENTGLNTSATITMNTVEGFNDNASTIAKQTTGGIDMSTRTNAMTLGFGSSSDIYSWFLNGSLRLGTGTTLAAGFNFIFSGSGTILSNGKTITNNNYGYVQIAATGTYTLEDAFSSSTQPLVLTSGGLNTNGFNFTASAISTSNSNVRSLTFGSSLVTLSADDPLGTTTATNLTISNGTSIINCTSANLNFNSLNSTATPFNVRVGNTQNCALTNTALRTFNNFSISTSLTSYTARTVTLAGPITANGTFTATTGGVTQRISVASSVTGAQRTLTAASVSLSNVNFGSINAAGAATPFTGTSLGDLGFNSNITFTAAKTVYWVTAAGGNWTANNWSTISGGSAVEADFPLPQDTAVIQNTGLNASATVTLNNVAGFNYAPTIDMSTRTNAMTLALSTAYTVYGNWINGSGTTISGAQSPIFSGGGNTTLTSAGKTFSSGITVDKSTATFTLADALNIGGNTLTLTSGTFDTGNFNVTGGVLSSTNSNVRTLTLGSSIITLSNNDPINTATATNLTINNGTSWISCTGNSVAFANLNATLTPFNIRVGATQNTTLSNIRTHNKLQAVGPGTAGYRTITFAAGAQMTILTGLETTSTAIQNRVLFTAATVGLQNTLIINGAGSSLSDADFRDIYVRGSGVPITGTRIGDLRGNIGITFPTKTVYWNLAGTQNFNAVAWADSSGGTPAANNFPLPQDTAVFNNSGAVGTVTLNNSGFNWMPTIDMSARTTGMTISLQAAYTVYGDWITSSAVTLSGSQVLTFAGRNNQTITTAGKNFYSVTVDSIGGSVSLNDACSMISASQLVVTNGTFNTNGYTFTPLSINSSNNNVRTINFGASVVTISDVFNVNGANLTFNAGTSTVQVTFNNPNTSLLPGNLTFYNFTFTSTALGNRRLRGANTFNNLTLVASATGVTTLTLFADQVVNGTFTCAGSSVIARGSVITDNEAVSRTITAANVVADNCDFRNITFLGAASPISPALAGDLGGNSGITFPAPKTVYWNLAGTQNWNNTAWADTSGGAPAINNFPLAQDTAVFDDAGSAGTVNVGTVAYNFPAIDASARTSAMTLSHNGAQEIFGGYTLGSGVTVSGTSALTFAGASAQTITSAGKTITFPITVGLVGRTSTSVSLSGSYTASNSITLTSGTFNAANNTVTITAFSSSNSNVRTLTMGSGVWTLSGTGTVWDTGNAGNLTFNKNTSNIELSNTTTTARTFSGGSLTFNKLTIGGATGTSTLTISGNNQFAELASTKTVAHTILFDNNGTTTVGKWSITGTSGNVVTLNRVSTGVWNIVLAGDVPTGINFLAVNNCTVADASPAEFYVGANSTLTTTTRVVNTAPPAARTLYWVGGTGNWGDTARWSLASGGGGGEAVPRSFDDVIFDSASNATAYTATVNVTARCKSLTVAGPASGNLTFAGASTLICHGNVSFPATGFTRTFTGAVILSSTATGLTYTTNGQAFASSVTVNGVGCSWTLGSALNIGATTFNVTNGTFGTGNFNLTCNDLVSSNFNDRSISLGSSTISLAAATPINFGNLTNFTFNAGTSLLSCTNTTPSFNGNGLTYYNVTFTDGTLTAKSINGSNTFNNLTANSTTTGLMNVVFSANQTVNGTFTAAGNSAINRVFVRSDVFGTTRTITAATLAANDCDFRDITIAGVAAGTTPTRAGDCGGNTGVTFSSKTVYWNLTGTQNWNATAWATTANGSPNVVNFPLPQDTATFTNSGAATTVNFGTVVYNFPNINAATRTTAMTLGQNGPQTLYGSYILGSGITVSGTSAQTFAGRGTMTFTSAGKTITFPITLDTPTGTFQLGGALNSSSSLTVTRGTFDAVTYAVTISSFSSNNSNVRTINMGSGLWSITGINATIWDMGNSANATLNKGSANIILTNTGTQQRTFAGGGLSYNKLTIGGATGIATVTIQQNNTFTELASTKTVAHTIALGTTIQRVAAWTVTGTANNVVSVTGTGSVLIYTSSGNTQNVDYLNIQGRAYGPNGEITGVWYAGTNSINSATYGWLYEAGSPPPPPPAGNGNFFLMFA
jgi:hypothetical protein